jgi:uncharacterized protein DUF2087
LPAFVSEIARAKAKPSSRPAGAGWRTLESCPALIQHLASPGVRYPEQRVSQFLGALHPDYAALRRYLVDEELLTRSAGQYWRSGGTVPTAGDPR